MDHLPQRLRPLGLLLSCSVHTVMGNKQAWPVLHSTSALNSPLYGLILHLERLDKQYYCLYGTFLDNDR